MILACIIRSLQRQCFRGQSQYRGVVTNRRRTLLAAPKANAASTVQVTIHRDLHSHARSLPPAVGPSSRFRTTATHPPFNIRAASAMALKRSNDPLVWIDCEMTGLDPSKDVILSISCYVTNHVLELLEPHGYHAVISTPSSVLSSMNDWCIKTHTATGLVDACQSTSAISASQAATELLGYIKQHVPQQRVALLAGNSVHADKMFLMNEPWASVLEWLHYRILDVSAIKEAARRWADEDVLRNVPRKKLTHTADEDIRESLDEARYYMGLFQNMETSRKSVEGG